MATKDKTVKKAVLGKKAKDSGALRALTPLAKEINVRLGKAAKLEGDAADHRLAAAIGMKDAKEMCDKSKINFKKWAEAHLDAKYNSIRKSLMIAQAKDPKAKMDEVREQNKAANKTLRTKAKEEKKAVTAVTAQTPADRILGGFDVIDEKSGIALVKSQAENYGIILATKDTFAEAKGVSLQFVKRAYTLLTPLERAEFIEWATAPAVETAEELDEIPGFLDKRASGKSVSKAA